MLANLAGKAAAALPGVNGSIVSWLLSATGKVVNWFGNNLWALVVHVAGLLYAVAKEWINKSQIMKATDPTMMLSRISAVLLFS